MSNISSTSHKKTQLEQTKPLGWRDQFCVKGKTDLWRLMQQIDPDKEVRDLVELQSRVRPVAKASVTTMIEFKKMCLQSGIDPSAVLAQLEQLVPHRKAQLEKSVDPVSAALALPLNSAAKSVWIGAFFKQFFSKKGSEEAKTAARVMEETQTFERALILVSLLHDGYHIVRGSREVAKLKAMLEPLLDKDRADCLKQKKELQAQIECAVSSHKEMDTEFFSSFHELMLLKARLYPDKYAEFRKLIKAQIDEIEKSTNESRQNLKETVKLAAFDIADVVLEIVDPTGLLKSGVSLVIKTQGLHEKISAAHKTVQEVRKSLSERKIAQIYLDDLIDEAARDAGQKLLNPNPSQGQEETTDPTNPMDVVSPSGETSETVSDPSEVSELPKTVQEKDGAKLVKLANTVARVNRCYWQSQKERHIENVSMKTLGVAGGLLGLAGLVCKILAIVSIAVGITGLMASSFGLAGVVILSLVLAFKAGLYAYKHREEIGCRLRVIGFQILSALANVANKISFGKLSERVSYYHHQVEDAKSHLEVARLKTKIGQVGVTRLKKLAAHHFEVIKQTDASQRNDLSTRVFFAITGKAPKHAFEEAKSEQDLQDRFVASVVEDMTSR